MDKYKIDIACLQEVKIPTNSFFKISDYFIATSTDIKSSGKTKSISPRPPKKEATRKRNLVLNYRMTAFCRKASHSRKRKRKIKQKLSRDLEKEGVKKAKATLNIMAWP